MKLKILTAIFSLLTFFACHEPKKTLEKSWQGKPIDFTQIKEVVNTYYMHDSTNTKVGSMVFGFSFENGFLIARDTSQFDNGSVYETAELTFDTTNFQMKKVSIDMKTQRATLDIDLSREGDNLIGSYEIQRDTTTTSYEIDSVFQFSGFREEIYILAHALKLNLNDTLSLTALVPTSMSLSNGQLINAGEETIETINGMQACDVIWLRADGKMPDNKIWISKSTPRTIVKFYVPGPELEIKLVSHH